MHWSKMEGKMITYQYVIDIQSIKWFNWTCKWIAISSKAKVFLHIWWVYYNYFEISNTSV